MASFTFRLVLLFFFVISVAGRARSRDYRVRALWGDLKHKMKETAVDRFHLDLRRFDREDMLLFPDVAFQSTDSNGPWTVVVHGWRFEGSKRKDWLGFSTSKWVERLAHEILNPNQVAYLNGSINRDRLKPFFVEDESKEVVSIRLGDQTHYVKTNHYGQFYEELKISDEQMKQLRAQQQRTKTITYQAVGDNQDTSTGLTYLIEPREGISVISDIDDTIKISEVLDKVRLLANTFIHDFKAVTGMAELYQQWQTAYVDCTFHYLSGMPDQLYMLTEEFIQKNQFPSGSFHMRHLDWGISSLFHFLHSESTMNHKLSYLHFFLDNTVRDYVLVGDSGEKDPEIYGIITREYPNRIRAIFIRAIKGEDFSDQRFLTAFNGIPREKWQVFDDPKQVPIDLSKAPGAVGG